MRYLKIFLSIFLAGIFISPFFIIPRIIKIEKFECVSQFGPCGAEVELSLKALGGSSLEAAKKKAGQVLSGDLTIESYFLQYKLPNILAVSLVVRKPKFAFQGKEERVLVDEKGVVLGKEAMGTLPTIISDQPIPKVGEKVSDETIFASNILYGMFYLFAAKSGRISDDSFSLDIPNGPKVIFPLEGDKDTLLGAANLIVSRLNSGDKDLRIGNVKEIDLRFKNPVLR